MNTEEVKVAESIVVEEIFVDGKLVAETITETFEIETGHESAEAEISIELYNDAEHRRKHFRAVKTAILLDVLDEGARKLDVRLLPDPQKPLDLLRGVYRDHAVGIRDDLKQRAVLGDGETLQRHIPLQWTEAQKKDISNYQPDQVLVFHRASHGIEKHEALTVKLSRRPSRSEA